MKLLKIASTFFVICLLGACSNIGKSYVEKENIDENAITLVFSLDGKESYYNLIWLESLTLSEDKKLNRPIIESPRQYFDKPSDKKYFVIKINKKMRKNNYIAITNIGIEPYKYEPANYINYTACEKYGTNLFAFNSSTSGIYYLGDIFINDSNKNTNYSVQNNYKDAAKFLAENYTISDREKIIFSPIKTFPSKVHCAGLTIYL